MPDKQEAYGRLMEDAMERLFKGEYRRGFVRGHGGFELRHIDQERGAAVVRLMLFDNETHEPLVHFGDFTVYVDTKLSVEDWQHDAEISLTSDGKVYTRRKEKE